MNFDIEVPEGLNPALTALGWLVGRWEGTGNGTDHEGNGFEFEQRIEFMRTAQPSGGTTNMPALDFGSGATMGLSGVTASASVPGGDETLTVGSMFANRYRVLETLGRGGMGVVFRAKDNQLDEVVALKTLRSDVLSQDSTLLQRFKLEIKLARKITHKNVLRTHDFGEWM
mgnify:CR=1 FL=1